MTGASLHLARVPLLQAYVLCAFALLSAVTGCSASPAEARAMGATDRSRGGAMWGRNYFPNIPLTSQKGERVGFFDLIEGKVVAINFIYTKCADSCPMETARMLEVQRLLGDRVGKDVFIYSISIDPEHDTPQRLRAYAETWHVGPGWTFLTGSEADVTLLRKKLGVYEPNPNKRDHNLGLVIGNQKTGRWMKRSSYENPYVLATQIGSWLHNWKLPSTGSRDYADAPEVRNISSGEELFRARCSSCHTVGGDAAHSEHPVGPDLEGVVGRRPRAWLERWLREPDRMLAERDPIALDLLARSGGVAMPNLRLAQDEVAALLDYLDEASRPVQQHAEAGAPLAAKQALVAAYDGVRDRLAADDLDGARAAARPLSVVASAQPALRGVASSAQGVLTADSIERARTAFAVLSKRVVLAVAEEPVLRDTLFLFECPMVPGYKRWVQRDLALRNPYWGRRMLHCGARVADWHHVD